MRPLIYGTAWKEERTKDLVVQAFHLGFRAVDTACQPKHYHEKGVGDALRVLFAEGLQRSDLFIQTKFTPIAGHDPARIPYDSKAPIETQVQQSFAVSLQNLGVDYLDSLVLHSPYPAYTDLVTAWRALEEICQSGGTKQIGISNIYDLSVAKALFADAKIKPKVIQNRFYAETDYDKEIRRWCLAHDISYQGFWTLTANPHVAESPLLRSLATEIKKTPQQIYFRFLTQIGIDPLVGSCSRQHCTEALQIRDFTLEEKTVKRILSVFVLD